MRDQLAVGVLHGEQAAFGTQVDRVVGQIEGALDEELPYVAENRVCNGGDGAEVLTHIRGACQAQIRVRSGVGGLGGQTRDPSHDRAAR